jgi:hypothetical protein
MKNRVVSQQGTAIYGHRMPVVEPAFGNNTRLNRLSLRSEKKVQWQWYCLVHNIEKLANYGQLAACCRSMRSRKIAMKRLTILRFP